MTRLTGFIACLAVMWTIFPAMASDDHEEARRLQQAGDILPLETIIEKAQAIHPGRILEVELESENSHYYYEIELLDDNGRVWEMKLDSQTGKPINQEEDD
jgi:uncharacterized membrane protein YkoI